MFAVSDGNRADDDPIFQHNTQHQEDKVEEKHGETQHLIHLPFTGCDGDDDKEEHEEEQHDGTEQAVGADGHRLAGMQGSVYKPGDRQAESTKGR